MIRKVVKGLIIQCALPKQNTITFYIDRNAIKILALFYTNYIF